MNSESMTPKQMVFESLKRLIPWLDQQADLNAQREILKASLERIASWEPLLVDCPNVLALAQRGLGRSVDEGEEDSSHE